MSVQQYDFRMLIIFSIFQAEMQLYLSLQVCKLQGGPAR